MQATKDMAKEAKNLNNYFLGDLRQDEKRLSRTGRNYNDLREELSDNLSIIDIPQEDVFLHKFKIIVGSSVFDSRDGRTKYNMLVQKKDEPIAEEYKPFSSIESARRAEERLVSKLERSCCGKYVDIRIKKNESGYNLLLTITSQESSIPLLRNVLVKNGYFERADYRV